MPIGLVSAALIDTLLPHVDSLPTFGCEIFIAQMGGATNRVPVDATAYPHRNVEFIMNVHGRWDEPAGDERGIAWCRGVFAAATPYATGVVYTNFMGEPVEDERPPAAGSDGAEVVTVFGVEFDMQEESDRVGAAYGESWERLVELKNKYDPDNFLRLNQNIPPTKQE